MPDASYDFVARSQGLVRSLPLWAGGLGFASLLANRTLSGVSNPRGSLAARAAHAPHAPALPTLGMPRHVASACRDADAGGCVHLSLLQIAPVVDASSSQSRADVLGIIMSAILLLTGLQWLALKAKPVQSVSGPGRAGHICALTHHVPRQPGGRLVTGWAVQRLAPGQTLPHHRLTDCSRCTHAAPQVGLDGVQVNWVDKDAKLPAAAQQEMEWAWQSLSRAARVSSLVFMYQ